MNNIKLSIVTVCKNSELTIRDTLNSVLNVLSINNSFEYIVQDSLSDDSTLSIVEEFSEKLVNLKVFSEEDNGIYDGMNKALSKCKGKYVLFLNSDDILLSQFNKVLESIFDNEEIDYFISPVIMFKRPNYKIKRVFLPQPKKMEPLKSLLYSFIPSHPGFICNRELLKKNKFDIKYKIAADYEQILKIMSNAKYKKRVFEKPYLAMAMGGQSNTYRGFKIAMGEMLIINKKFNFKEKLLLRYLRNAFQYLLPVFLRKKLELRKIEKELAIYKII